MNLMERYVHEVGRRLPRKDRADIEAELYSTLEDMLEDRVADEATEEDEVALLNEFGPPAKVAASYRGGDPYLIGPDLFPVFRIVTGIVILVIAIVQLALAGVKIVFTPGYFPSFEWVFAFLASLVSAFGYVVVTFAALQYFGVKPEMEDEFWDPRSLPEPYDEDPVSPTGLIVETTFGLIFVALLVFLPDILELLASLGLQTVNNPILQESLGWIFVPILLGIGLNVILLWRGEWTTFTRVLKIIINVVGITVLYFLIDTHAAWLEANGAGSGLFSVFEAIPESGKMPIEASQLLGMWAFRLGFVVAFVVIIVETIRLTYQLVKNTIFSERLSLPIKVEDHK